MILMIRGNVVEVWCLQMSVLMEHEIVENDCYNLTEK